MCAEMIIATAAKCRFCGTILDPRLPLRQGYQTPLAGAAERSRKIRRYFKFWWINAVFGFVFCLTIVGAIVGLPMIIVGAVYYYMLMYQLWSTVQDGRAETTPGNAVGFMFIPCFYLYWQFVAFWGLAKDLNRFSREHSIPAPPANEQRALTACILHCCAIIPYLGLLPALAGLVITVIELKNMRDVAVVINEGVAARAV